ncbi:MAG: DUF2167 domain-containing protein [Myxococcota bacterium]
MPFSLLLSTALVLSSPTSPSPNTASAPDTNITDDSVSPEVAELLESAELPAELDPFVVALRAELDPEARAHFDALDEAQFQELIEKIGRESPLTGEEQAIADALQAVSIREFDAQLSYRSGDIELADGLAVLRLGEDFRYLGPDDTHKVLVDGWSNPPGPKTLGMIVPSTVSPLHPDQGWGVVITYAADGYVEDDEADDIDYDELLEQMQEATEADNHNRRSQGYPPLHLVGWAEPPHYDEASHRLYWAKELSSDGAPAHSLNYSIRVLGRRGVLELNAVAGMPQLPAIKPEMEKILSRVEFLTGNRYEDFDPDIDEVAAYGIGGLIAGKALAKAGFFAVLLKFLIAAKKFLLVGLVAIGVAIKGLFSRKKNDPTA